MLKLVLKILLTLNSKIRIMFYNLLEFLNWFQKQLSNMYEDIKDYLVKIFRITVNLLISFGKLSLFYLPGILCLLPSNLILRIIGVTYILIITSIGIFYSRSETSGNDKIETNLTWLTFFPMSWVNNSDFNMLIKELVDLYDSLKQLKKNTKNQVLIDTVKKGQKKLSINFKWAKANINNVIRLQKIKKQLIKKGNDHRLEAIDKQINIFKTQLTNNIKQTKNLICSLDKFEIETINDSIDSFELFDEEIIFLDEYRKLLQDG